MVYLYNICFLSYGSWYLMKSLEQNPLNNNGPCCFGYCVGDCARPDYGHGAWHGPHYARSQYISYFDDDDGESPRETVLPEMIAIRIWNRSSLSQM